MEHQRQLRPSLERRGAKGQDSRPQLHGETAFGGHIRVHAGRGAAWEDGPRGGGGIWETTRLRDPLPVFVSKRGRSDSEARPDVVPHHQLRRRRGLQPELAWPDAALRRLRPRLRRL